MRASVPARRRSLRASDGLAPSVPLDRWRGCGGATSPCAAGRGWLLWRGLALRSPPRTVWGRSRRLGLLRWRPLPGGTGRCRCPGLLRWRGAGSLRPGTGGWLSARSSRHGVRDRGLGLRECRLRLSSLRERGPQGRHRVDRPTGCGSLAGGSCLSSRWRASRGLRSTSGRRPASSSRRSCRSGAPGHCPGHLLARPGRVGPGRGRCARLPRHWRRCAPSAHRLLLPAGSADPHVHGLLDGRRDRHVHPGGQGHRHHDLELQLHLTREIAGHHSLHPTGHGQVEQSELAVLGRHVVLWEDVVTTEPGHQRREDVVLEGRCRCPHRHQVGQVVAASRCSSADDGTVVVEHQLEHHVATGRVLPHVVQEDVHRRPLHRPDPGPARCVEGDGHWRVAQGLAAQQRLERVVDLLEHRTPIVSRQRPVRPQVPS